MALVARLRALLSGFGSRPFTASARSRPSASRFLGLSYSAHHVSRGAAQSLTVWRHRRRSGSAKVSVRRSRTHQAISDAAAKKLPSRSAFACMIPNTGLHAGLWASRRQGHGDVDFRLWSWFLVLSDSRRPHVYRSKDYELWVGSHRFEISSTAAAGSLKTITHPRRCAIPCVGIVIDGQSLTRNRV